MGAKVSPSASQISRVEVGALVALLAIALLFAPTPNSRAQVQQDKRQLQREQKSVAQQRRIALVIGNGAYQTVKTLKNPPNDATLLAATLRKLGFEVTVGTDKSQREMKLLIREFGQRLRAGGGVGLFYFAGHGVQARGHNYLIPVDADIQTEADLEDAAVDVNYVLNTMDDAQNALNIAILDACRNNPFGRSFRSAQEGLAQVKAPTGTLIAYATSPDSVAADGGGTNSPYTEELTKQLKVSGVLLETMFRRVAEQVSSRTGGRQEPWYSANVKGDFYFSASPNSSLANTAAKIDVVAVEREYWETIRSSNAAQDYKDYLQAYPNGAYIAIARAKIKQLEAAKSDTTNSPSWSRLGEDMATAASRGFKNKQGIEMVYIPPGRFKMGSNTKENEKPVHEVTIGQGFFMGKYEVTQGQWQAVMGTTLNQQRDKASFRFSENLGEGANYPMYYVSWEEARDFVRHLNDSDSGYAYRLPSESEWEYACRAGSIGDYAGDLDSMAWYGNNSGDRYLNADSIFRNDLDNYSARLSSNGVRTHTVGTKQANSFGLYDMHGNVSEWCEDWYHNNYSGAPIDGSPWLSQGEWKSRVSRGGSWADIALWLRSAHRSVQSSANLGGGGPADGFRVVAVVRTP